MTKSNYVAATSPHTENDPVVTPDELKVIERRLNGHSTQLSRAFMVTYNQGDFRRLKMAVTNADIEPPPLRSVRKDHKTVPPDE